MRTWGAFKNVVALACGLVDGLKTIGTLGGDNLKAAIFSAGFKEGCILLPLLGARAEVAFGPAGLGDLYVTSTSPFGRNSPWVRNLEQERHWKKLSKK